MNILLVSSTLDEDGGLPVCVGRLGTALAEAGHRVTILGQGWGGICDAIAHARDVARVDCVEIRCDWTARGQLAAARRAAAHVAEWVQRREVGREVSVVHTHGVWTPVVLSAAETTLARGRPLVISPHGMLRTMALARSHQLKRLAWTACVRRQVASAASVHATSAAEAADLRRLAGEGLAPRVIPWGIDAVARGVGAREPTGRRIAACIGRMLPIKGIDMLIDAWAIVRPEGWHLRLIGPCDHAMRAALDRRIAERGLARDVSFEPPFDRRDLPRALADVSLVVCPSRSENFALIVGESLAAGVPVITTTETAWRDVDRVGCGWLVAPEAAAIATGLASATAATAASLAKMGDRGAAWVAAEFGWSAIADRMVRELYEPAS